MNAFRTLTEILAAVLLVAIVILICVLVVTAFMLERYVSHNRRIAAEISRTLRRVY